MKIYNGYELADNSEFIDFLETELIPTFIRKFNSACDIEIPMTEDNDFKDMEFREGEFYTLLHYSNKESKYYNCNIKGVIFQLLDDFELQF